MDPEYLSENYESSNFNEEEIKSTLEIDISSSKNIAHDLVSP